MTRKAVAAIVVTLVACFPAVGAILASSGLVHPMSPTAMDRCRGELAELGTCQVTCAQWQAIAGVGGQWSCTGQNNGAWCMRCVILGNTYTYPDQSSTACPGTWKTQGNPQDCGQQTQLFTATCLNKICQGGKFGALPCDDPKQAVAQAGH